jgi:hypothetical protein
MSADLQEAASQARQCRLDTMGAVTAAQVQEMVLILYSDPARSVEANAWLVEFQSQSQAWQLAQQLSQSEAEEVRFYAANVLLQARLNPT